MSNAISSWFKWSVMSVALAALAAFVIPVRAQDTTNSAAPHTGFVDDWTHHHVVFSNPGTRDEAVKNGTVDRWTRIVNDPRYKLQQVKRSLGTRPVMTNPDFGSRPEDPWDWNRGPRRDRGPHDLRPGNGVKNDWSAPLGGGGSFASGGVGGTVPGGANFSNNSTLTIELTFFHFDFGLLTLQASDAPGCTPSGGTDYPRYAPAVFCYTATSTAGQIAASIAQAFNDSWLGGWFTASSNSSGGIIITFKYGGGDPIFLSIVAYDIPGYTSGTTGVLATVQPNAYPAKYSWSTTTASCSTDFVVYPTGQAGSSSAANIIAYNELYGSTPAGGTGDGTGCDASGGVNVPTAYWAYNTGSGEMVSTSPVLSMDGTQVAFVESNGSTANLVLLKWKSSTSYSISVPDALTSQTSGASYRSCTAPCMYAIGLGHDDAGSAPYYDYINDAIYVGDNSGNLHQFTGVFLGTPAAGWSASLGGKLSSPVYDSTSGNIWVGNMSGTLYSVTNAGTVNGSTTIADAIADGPLVDSTAEQVYVFVGDCAVCSDSNADAVFQFPATGAFIPSVVELGAGGAGYYLYSGTFDNTYYTSEAGGSSTPTGYLYSVGNTGPGAGGGNLYQVPINAGVLGAPSSVVSNLTTSGVSPWPSPVTEYYNSGTDYVFFSVNAGTEIPYGCTTVAGNGGCILSFTVTNPSSVNPSGGQSLANVPGNGCWATGGISVDNSVSSTSTTTPGSNIYFVDLNGAIAGSVDGHTSSQCGSSTNVTISAIQGTQATP